MCYHPWVGLDISPQGLFKPCCKYKDTIANSFQSYIESTELAQLKKEFLEGKKPGGCYRCWRDEEAGITSKRQLDQKHIFNNTTPSLNQISVISLPFGNTCNLACRICNSASSSKWRDEAKKLQHTFTEIKIYDHVKFYDDPSFMNPIFSLVPNIIHIDIPGGEPFVVKSKKHQQLIDLVSNHKPDQVTIHYTTNCTQFPEESLWSQWKKFKQVDIQLSIDGIAKQFEYNRWPAKWDECYKNIKKYQQKTAEFNNIKISISHSVSIFTVFYLPEFLDWCKNNNLPDPWLGLVTNPLHYNITVFPKDVKNRIMEKLQKKIELSAIVQALNAKDDSDQFDKTLKYVKTLDKQRNQNFTETFPELYQLLEKKCHTLYQQY